MSFRAGSPVFPRALILLVSSGRISSAVSSGAFPLQERLMAMSPSMAALAEATRMLIFPISTRLSDEKARLLMNMDIVNPIPPSTLIESNCVNVTPVGLAASFSLMLTKLKRKMPAGLCWKRGKMT